MTQAEKRIIGFILPSVHETTINTGLLTCAGANPQMPVDPSGHKSKHIKVR